MTSIVIAVVLTAALLFFYKKLSDAKSNLIRETARIRDEFENNTVLLNEEKNRLLAVLSSMTEGVVVIDADKKIRLANAMLTKSFKLSSGQPEGRAYWEIFRESEINEMIEQVFKNRRSERREVSTQVLNSQFQIQASPVYAEGDFAGVVVVFHDVTRLKELERLKSEFAGNVSHELKTPLTSILGFVETLKEGGMEDTENRGKFLSVIDEQSKKLYKLIEDLLTLSSLEQGVYKGEKNDVEIELLLKRLISAYNEQAQDKKIKISTSVDKDAKKIPAIGTLLERALSNLIDNALKYNREGGTIDIRVTKERNQYKITVSDTGVGIPTDSIPRIFERFYRVDKSRARASGGSGLGLSIVKHIMEVHEGSVVVQSIEQTGSQFILYFPA